MHFDDVLSKSMMFLETPVDLGDKVSPAALSQGCFACWETKTNTAAAGNIWFQHSSVCSNPPCWLCGGLVTLAKVKKDERKMNAKHLEPPENAHVLKRGAPLWSFPCALSDEKLVNDMYHLHIKQRVPSKLCSRQSPRSLTAACIQSEPCNPGHAAIPHTHRYSGPVAARACSLLSGLHGFQMTSDWKNYVLFFPQDNTAVKLKGQYMDLFNHKGACRSMTCKPKQRVCWMMYI